MHLLNAEAAVVCANRTPPGVGQLRIGMTVEEAEATGEAYYVPAQNGLPQNLVASDPGLHICVDWSANTIQSLLVKDGHPWSTPEGIRLGDDAATVAKAYPHARTVVEGSTFLLVDNGGWGYQFYVDGVVKTIVFGEEIGEFVMYHC
jgi:hypothetical protein